MADHSSILAWKIPWTEGPGRLHSMGMQRVNTTEGLNTHAIMWNEEETQTNHKPLDVNDQ